MKLEDRIEEYIEATEREQHSEIGSAVDVLEIREDVVILDLPADIRDCERKIPQDAIEFGNEAKAWFSWDLSTKQPRAPHQGGYAGTVRWGREHVDWDSRIGGAYEDVLASLNDNVNGYCDPEWYWGNDSPSELYPMLIIPHKKFSPDPGLILIDLDDVVNLTDDGRGEMTREAWDIIEAFDAFGEISMSMTGAHVLVRGKIPDFVDGKQMLADLDDGGHVEIRGYPGNGRIIGTTWAHINETPAEIPEAQDVIDSLVDELLDDEDKLSEKEQAQRVLNKSKRGNIDRFDSGGASNRSAYYDLNPVKIAQTGPFLAHAVDGQGPHPKHGGTSSADSESTNFTVDPDNGWCCFAHDEDGGGALHLIAVMEGIRACGNAGDVMDDPVDALRTCLAARDEYADSRLDDKNPPLVALKGVLKIQGIDYPATGKIPSKKYKAARSLYDEMAYTGSDSC